MQTLAPSHQDIPALRGTAWMTYNSGKNTVAVMDLLG